MLLAAVQGLTEFLPISSTGHLVIFQSILGFKEAPVLLDVMLHVGTLVAVFLYFRQEISQIVLGLIKLKKDSIQLASLVIIATIPAVIVGGIFENQIGQTFNALRLNGGFFLLTAFLLFSTYFVKNNHKEIVHLNWKDALFIGLFQALAILPAVSRSGATISAALFRGVSRAAAFRFSFYLFIPAIVGALVLQLPDLSRSSVLEFKYYFFGMLIAGLLGYFSLIILESVLKSSKFYLFGFYCLVIGLLLLFL